MPSHASKKHSRQRRWEIVLGTFLEIEGAFNKLNFESIWFSAEKFKIFPKLTNWTMNILNNRFKVVGYHTLGFLSGAGSSAGWGPVTYTMEYISRQSNCKTKLKRSVYAS